jgi:hypothetical protein
MLSGTPSPKDDPKQGLPQDPAREGHQPYASEVEDYARGVANPPEESARRGRGRAPDPGTKRKPARD